jgi:hypothetical protein
MNAKDARVGQRVMAGQEHRLRAGHWNCCRPPSSLAWFAFIKGVPEANKELVYMALGSLITMSGTILNFHRGSSQGSKDKGARHSKAQGPEMKANFESALKAVLHHEGGF